MTKNAAHSDHVVELRVGDRVVVLPMSALRFVSSFRAAKLHPVSTPDPCVVGLVEVASELSTVVDLSALISGEAVERRPGARLVTTDGAGVLLTLLVDSISEPLEAQPVEEKARHAEDDQAVPGDLVAGRMRLGGGETAALLDLKRIVARVGGAGHGE